MTRTIKLTLTTTAALILLATTATYALFTNGGFEAGDFSGGWVKSRFRNLRPERLGAVQRLEHRPHRRAARIAPAGRSARRSHRCR